MVSATCCIITGLVFLVCLVGVFCLTVGIMEATKSAGAVIDAVGDAQPRINEFLEDLNRNEFYEYNLRFEMSSEHESYDGEYSQRYFIEISST
jgi:hypothetical protein